MYAIIVAISLVSFVSCANPGESDRKIVVTDDPLQLFEGQISEDMVSVNNTEKYESLGQYYDMLVETNLKKMLDSAQTENLKIDVENSLIELGAENVSDFYNGMEIYLSPYDFLDHNVTMRVDYSGKFYAYLPTLKTNIVNYRIYAYKHIPVVITNLISAEKTNLCLEISSIEDVKNALDSIDLNSFMVELLRAPCVEKSLH